MNVSFWQLHEQRMDLFGISEKCIGLCTVLNKVVMQCTVLIRVAWYAGLDNNFAVKNYFEEV